MKRPNETRRRRECCNEKEVRREKSQNYAELEGRRREREEKMKTLAAQQQKHSIRPAKIIKQTHTCLLAVTCTRRCGATFSYQNTNTDGNW